MSETYESPVKYRARNVINEDRYRDGIEPGLKYNTGCMYTTLHDAFTDFNLDITVPRWISKEFSQVSTNFALGLYEFTSFVDDRKDRLGFNVNEIVLMEYYDLLLSRRGIHRETKFRVTLKKGNFEKKDANSGVMTEIEKEILKSNEALAVLCQRIEDAHIFYIPGDFEERDLILKQVRDEGYQAVGYVTFKKTQ